MFYFAFCIDVVRNVYTENIQKFILPPQTDSRTACNIFREG